MPEFVVVGGGITGAFAAWSLAGLGAGVTLVERGEVGGEASGANPGGLNPLYGAGIPGPLQSLALESFRLHLEAWDEIGRVSGIDFGGHPADRLHVALDDADVAALERAREPYDSTPGFSADWLEPAEARELEPGLIASLAGGLRAEGDAKVQAGPYTRAVATAAVQRGARIRTGEAHGLRTDGSRVTGVAMDGEVVGCDGVVIAAGPWCEAPACWLGTTIPVAPVKGELLLIGPQVGLPGRDVAWRDAVAYRAPGGRAWLGGTEEPGGFDRTPSPAARASILERVGTVLPALAAAWVERHTAALRPTTPDGRPIVGPAPGWENAFLAVGSGRKGMLLAAGIGAAVAELLVQGRTGLPIEPCSPERFDA